MTILVSITDRGFNGSVGLDSCSISTRQEHQIYEPENTMEH